MKKRFTILISFILFVFLSLSFNVYAKEENQNNSQYDEILLNETNTYNGKIETVNRTIYHNGLKEHSYKVPKYDMSSKNNNIVSDEAPKLTFITHGLSGNYESWRIEDKFEGGLIDQLNQSTSCDFYVGKVVRKDLTKDGPVGLVFNKITIKPTENKISYGDDLKKIEKSPKHYVIIFSSSIYESENFESGNVEHILTSSNINDEVYYDFNYMASVVIKQIKDSDPSHRLPKVNLIGHSRGGITNLQFALDHPDLVESMYSLGTPYLGTTIGSIHKTVNELGLFTESIPFPIGEADIIDENTYNNYYNRWNNNYDELYKNINVIALGSYSDLDFLLYSLIQYLADKFKFPMLSKEEYLDIINPLIGINAVSLLEGIAISKAALVVIVTTYLTSLVTNNLSEKIPALERNEALEGVVNLAHLMIDEIKFKLNEFEFEIYDDLCVDLDSQLGKDEYLNKQYKGFKTYVKKYQFEDVVDLTRTVSPNAPAVPHNLEPLDTELIGVIVKNMTTNTPKNCDYIVSENIEGLSILRYIGNGESPTLTIPSIINNKPVTMICSNAFSNLMNTNPNITEIVIPRSIKIIEERAFKNNENIEKITFEDNSKLTNIEDESFADIPKLTYI